MLEITVQQAHFVKLIAKHEVTPVCLITNQCVTGYNSIYHFQQLLGSALPRMIRRLKPSFLGASRVDACIHNQ